MTWAPLLLADRSASLRWLVLTELMGKPVDDPEVVELAAIREDDSLVKDLLALQAKDGRWKAPNGGGEPWMGIRTTSHALLRLGYLGFGPEYPPVQRGAAYLFSLQEEDGSWPLPKIKAERELREAYEEIPLQTSFPLRGLAAAGYASDLHCERAYEWLLSRKLADGGWPSGVKAGQNVFPAGYRRLAQSRFACRTNTILAVSALAYHPELCTGQAARQGLDLLLVQETLQSHALGVEVARYTGAEQAGGFFTYFARHDIGMVIDLCWRVGASLEDRRVGDLVQAIADLQGPYGLWEHPIYPQVSRWLSFDLLRSLSRLDDHGDWISLRPRTPFQAYPKFTPRY